MSTEATQSNWLVKNWPTLVLVLLGVSLIGVAAWIAQSNDIVRRLALDFKGSRGMATVEPMGPDQYRMRFTQESAIYSRLYKGKIAGAQEGAESFQIPIVFEPSDPGRFLPAGLSYKPAIFAGLLFVAGMAISLYARRGAYAAARLQSQLAQASVKQKPVKGDRQHGKHRHRSHHHHGTSHRSTGG